MKRRAILFLTLLSSLIFLITISGQGQNKKLTEKLFADIAGTWRLQTIFNGIQDVTRKDSLSVQWIEFTEKGRYRSETGKQSLDSGSYRVNESSHAIYLQSDFDLANPVEWSVMFQDNTMTLIVKGTPHLERLKYVFIKTKSKETANRPVKPQQ